MAEKQGFEPWMTFAMPVFKTGAIDHSATSPFVCFNVHAIFKKIGSPSWIRTNDQMVNSHLLYR